MLELDQGEKRTVKDGLSRPRADTGGDTSAAVEPHSLTSAQQVTREVGGLESVPNKRLEEALGELLEASQDIVAAAVVNLDGFVEAALLPDGYGEERMGAMSAAMQSLGERTARELGRGELAQVFIEARQGYVFLLAAGEEAVLNVVVKRGSKLGLILYDIRNAAKRVAEIIETDLQAEHE